MTCCISCKGSPPWLICRDPVILGWLNTPDGCHCHIEADRLAIKTPNKLGHTDRTADTAISRIAHTEKRTR